MIFKPPHILLLCLLSAASACSSISYYAQSIEGQWQIMSASQPVETLLKEPGTAPALRQRLELAQALREFASRELGLPDNDSYRHYADIRRDFVVWNVFAAPALSLESREWCYLLIGCLEYRGYFSRADALHTAGELEAAGYDTWVGGVVAYSTLGWFDDPLLNTMLHRDEDYLARIIFHELAHQQVYIKNATALNEAFAETVADAGLRRWYSRQGDPQRMLNFRQTRFWEEKFVDLVLRYRDRLSAVYADVISEKEKLAEKQRLFQAMVNEYQALRSIHDDDRYDLWFATGLNNAKLLAVATYRRYVPALEKQLQILGGDLPAFYTFMKRLGECPLESRRAFLETGTEPAC